MSRRIMIVALLATELSALAAALALGGVRSCAAQATAAPVAAPAAWQKEFDAVCSRTQDAMSFSEDDLASLISRCDALQPQVERLDETRKKVYQSRLHMCRGIYQYVLDAKRATDDQSSSNPPAPEAWQKELDEICSRTQDAKSFSEEELASLISRCDALQLQIAKLDATQKRNYQGRLRTCRSVYANVLDRKQAEKN